MPVQSSAIEAAGLIKKEKNERPTSNIERPMFVLINFS